MVTGVPTTDVSYRFSGQVHQYLDNADHVIETIHRCLLPSNGATKLRRNVTIK
jgi:hypothetical protein